VDDVVVNEVGDEEVVDVAEEDIVVDNDEPRADDHEFIYIFHGRSCFK